MRRKTRFQLVNTTCPRCGKPTVTGNRSLWGADSLQQKYTGICTACITPEEREEINSNLAEFVYSTIKATV